MASKPLKRKLNRKRSSSMPESSNSMAFPKHLYLRKVFILPSIIFLFSVIIILGVSSSSWKKILADSHSIQLYGYEVVHEFHHDPGAFTQGLVYGGNDTLFESTGLYQQSSVRKVALQTGKVEILQRMDDSYFGEGLTLLGDRLFQVTWRTNDGFIYERKKMQKLQRFTHQMEDGWGLTTDGKILYGSDGTSKLYRIDPRTLKVTQKYNINFNGNALRYLNELEYINGEIWANVWQTDCIARISPDNGKILGWIFLQPLREGLKAAGYDGFDVLNGIAWDSDNNRIFVTGKLWPKLYEIKLHPAKKHFSDVEIQDLCLP